MDTEQESANFAALRGFIFSKSALLLSEIIISPNIDLGTDTGQWRHSNALYARWKTLM